MTAILVQGVLVGSSSGGSMSGVTSISDGTTVSMGAIVLVPGDANFAILNTAGTFTFTVSQNLNINTIAVGNGVVGIESGTQTASTVNTTIAGTLSCTLEDGSGNQINPGSLSPGSNGTAGTQSHIFSGTGDPNTVVTGIAGDYYFRVDGSVATHLYICTGATAWTGIV